MGESTYPKGVLSHETALSIHNLTDVLPAKIHLTVPEDFGVRETPPVLVLHRNNLAPSEIEQRAGYRVTSVLRTFLDLAAGGTLSKDVLVQGIFQAVERGTLTIEQVRNHKSLNEYLPEIQKYEDADSMYKLLRTFIKPPANRIPGYEQDLRKASVTLQAGLESLIKWVTKPRPNVAHRKLLKRGLRSQQQANNEDENRDAGTI
jgi:hypothetical protein